MEISSIDNYERKKIDINRSFMSYIDSGNGDVIIFIHGNPTSSFLWRNIIPSMDKTSRCIAPDLIGMGNSGKPDNCGYTFLEHYNYLSEFIEKMVPDGKITLVIHDWGSALGFYWAYNNPERIKGIVYMEALVRPITWEEWPENARNIFNLLRSDAGEELIFEKNIFVERILPNSAINGVSDAAMEIYRSPYSIAETRLPTLVWPREIQISGEPLHMVEIISNYAEFMMKSKFPKLFINADPGSILTGPQREFCRQWPNQKEVTVKGLHFILEDSPIEIGDEISKWLSEIE